VHSVLHTFRDEYRYITLPYYIHNTTEGVNNRALNEANTVEAFYTAFSCYNLGFCLVYSGILLSTVCYLLNNSFIHSDSCLLNIYHN
jgi:hypothetical protein